MPSPLGAGRRRRIRPYPAGAPRLGTPPFRPERGADPSRRPRLSPGQAISQLSALRASPSFLSGPLRLRAHPDSWARRTGLLKRGRAAWTSPAEKRPTGRRPRPTPPRPQPQLASHPLSPAPRGSGPMGRARLLGGSRGGGWDRRPRPPLALAHWMRTQGARRPECSGIGCRGSPRWRLLAGAAPVTPGGDWLPGLRGSCLSGSR